MNRRTEEYGCRRCASVTISRSTVCLSSDCKHSQDICKRGQAMDWGMRQIERRVKSRQQLSVQNRGDGSQGRRESLEAESARTFWHTATLNYMSMDRSSGNTQQQDLCPDMARPACRRWNLWKQQRMLCGRSDEGALVNASVARCRSVGALHPR